MLKRGVRHVVDEGGRWMCRCGEGQVWGWVEGAGVEMSGKVRFGSKWKGQVWGCVG